MKRHQQETKTIKAREIQRRKNVAAIDARIASQTRDQNQAEFDALMRIYPEVYSGWRKQAAFCNVLPIAKTPEDKLAENMAYETCQKLAEELFMLIPRKSALESALGIMPV